MDDRWAQKVHSPRFYSMQTHSTAEFLRPVFFGIAELRTDFWYWSLTITHECSQLLTIAHVFMAMILSRLSQTSSDMKLPYVPFRGPRDPNSTSRKDVLFTCGWSYLLNPFERRQKVGTLTSNLFIYSFIYFYLFIYTYIIYIYCLFHYIWYFFILYRVYQSYRTRRWRKFQK